MIGMGFFELLILLALGGSSGLPLGLPPKPQDPWMAKIAPVEPLYYVAWSERDLNPAADGNETERLLAEPEVQAFLKKLDTAVSRFMTVIAESEDQLWAVVAGDLARAMFTRATCLYVGEAQLGAEGIEGEAALVIDVEGQQELFTQRLEQVLAYLAEQEIEVAAETISIGGSEFRRFRLNPAAPTIDIGFHDKYLILAIGEKTIQGMLDRGKGEPPAWLNQMHQDLSVPRVASVCYLDLQGILERGRFATQLIPELAVAIDQLGIDAIGTYRCITGLDEEGLLIRSHLAVDGELPIAEALSREPLLPEDFARLPRDVHVAFVTKLDTLTMLSTVLPWFNLVGGDPDQIFEDVSEGIEPVIGMDLRTAFGDVLDDTLTIYAAPRDGGVVSGWVAAIGLQDSMAARASFDQAIGFLRAQKPEGLEFIVESHQGNSLVIFNGIADEFPFAITLGMNESELVIGVMPQAVRSHLLRAATSDSLADDPHISQWFAYDNMNGEGLRTVVRFDHAELARVLHPLMVWFADTMLESWEETASEYQIDLGVLDIPSTASLVPHLKPMTGALIRVEDGYRWEVRQTAPGGDLIAAIPVLAALGMPAVATANIAGARTTSINNLRQIGLAFHNYESAFGGMPSQANLDEKGKALLSWRVHILPFLGYADLYGQFHLDEPWDSDHNRTLIELMPPVYARSGLDATEGLTSYLGVAGRGAFLTKAKQPGPNAVGNRIANVVDGTSNTLMAVEVADAHRVIWTKPEDFEAAGMDPLELLVGNWKGRFLALTVDGAVHEIRDDIAEDDLRKLILISDGEVIDWSQIVK